VKRRECIHGMKDLTGETDMASVVEQQFRLKGVTCLKMRVRHKEMNDHDAYAAFLASEQLKRQMEASKEIVPALFTLSWFISNKPIQVKFPSRNTSQCTHCQQAMRLGGDGMQMHKACTPA